MFGADVRSLAAFRVVIAATVLIDLFGRSRNLKAHYTDAGIFPRWVALEEMGRYQFSLHLMNGTVFFQAVLFLVAAAAALALLVGLRTRLMTAVVWFLTLSLQWRNPDLLNGGDMLLRVLLFWSMFLPLGATASVDRWMGREPRPIEPVRISIPIVAFLLQIAFMYWFTAILKSGPEWRSEYTATYIALSAQQNVTWLGSLIYPHEGLLRALTFGTLWLEALGPFLLFFPFRTALARMIGILSFVALQVGIATTMAHMGLFNWFSAAIMVAFLPRDFWDRVLPRIQAARIARVPIAKRLETLELSLARFFPTPSMASAGSVPSMQSAASMQSTLNPDSKATTGDSRTDASPGRAEPLDSSPEPQLLDEHSSPKADLEAPIGDRRTGASPGNAEPLDSSPDPQLLDEHSSPKANLEATIEDSRTSASPGQAEPLDSLPDPQLSGQHSSPKADSESRPSTESHPSTESAPAAEPTPSNTDPMTASGDGDADGPTSPVPVSPVPTSVQTPAPSPQSGRWRQTASGVLAAAFLIFVVMWNLTTVTDLGIPRSFRAIAELTGLRQAWDMYAPRPYSSTSWVVVAGELDDGTEIDVLAPVLHSDTERARPVSWERPADVPAVFKDKYWSTFLGRFGGAHDDVRLTFGRWICREWNANHWDTDSELVRFDIVQVIEETLPGYEKAPPRHRELWRHWCR